MNAGQARRVIAKEARRPKRQCFFDTLADVPRNIEYEDGEHLYIKNDDGNYADHVFRRTSTTEPAGGQLLPTGVIITAADAWA